MQIRLQDTKVRKQIQITTFATFFLPDFRTFGGSLGRSTVAHFARKVRGANIAAAKHELKIQQSHAQKRWSCSLRARGPHFASKVSYNAGAATDDYSGPAHIFDARALLPIFYLEHPKVMRRRCSPYTFQRTRDEARPNVGRGTTERRTRRDRTQEGVRYKV